MPADLPAYDTALMEALAIVTPLNRLEHVPLADADNRILARDIVADRDLPPFNRAQMDGYALRAADLTMHDSFQVVGEVPAGTAPDVSIPPGCCVKIATGAPLPPDADTVIQHEHSDRRQPVHFTIDSIEPGHAVHARASDAQQGDLLVPAATLLRAHHIGICASVGVSNVAARARPRVAILSSGDELRALHERIVPHQIRDSNAPQTRALLRRMGAEVFHVEHCPDDLDATTTAVDHALRDGDLLVTIGGVSAGERDCFPAAFDALDIAFAVRGSAIQPGKPVRVGKAPSGAIVVALPGNPVSALVCACLFAWPVINRMLGQSADLPWREAALAAAVKPNARREAFRPAMLDADGRITVPPWAGSGDLCHTALTAGLSALPRRDDAVAAGEMIRFLPWP